MSPNDLIRLPQVPLSLGHLHGAVPVHAPEIPKSALEAPVFTLQESDQVAALLGQMVSFCSIFPKEFTHSTVQPISYLLRLR